jgi:hypothetical protein
MVQKVTISEALALSNWENLPATSFVRLPVVRGLLGGISAATVWRLVRAGTIKTYHLTPRTTSFSVGELRNLLAEKSVA